LYLKQNTLERSNNKKNQEQSNFMVAAPYHNDVLWWHTQELNDNFQVLIQSATQWASLASLYRITLGNRTGQFQKGV